MFPPKATGIHFNHQMSVSNTHSFFEVPNECTVFWKVSILFKLNPIHYGGKQEYSINLIPFAYIWNWAILLICSIFDHFQGQFDIVFLMAIMSNLAIIAIMTEKLLSRDWPNSRNIQNELS